MRKTRKDDNALQRTERLTILLTKAEFAELRERAGIVSLSGWIRARLFATAATQERFKEAEEAPMLVPGMLEPGRKVDEGDEAASEAAVAGDGVEAVQRGKRAKRRPRNNSAKSAAKHGEESSQDHVASQSQSVTSAVPATKTEMCQHDYGFKKCPIPLCRNYKWSE